MATSVVACGLGVVAAARPAAAKKSGAPNQAAGLRRKLVPGQAFNGVPLRLSAQSSRASRAAARRSHTPTAAAVAAAPEQDGKGPFVPWEGKLANKFRRTDIKRILILGAGPIVIGQACEFDYSGTQACKALSELGYEVILINSNPVRVSEQPPARETLEESIATIMTDPETASRTYVGPMTPQTVEEIIIKEKPDALLPTMGGQTALNLAVFLAESGVLKKHNVELIGAKLGAIQMAEDRLLFKEAMERIGLKCAESGACTTLEECLKVAEMIGCYPLVIRPAFTLGGTGGGIAYNREEFEKICAGGLEASTVTQVLVERSLLGWKEYELEVMRDLADNVVIVCSIENIDPMGVHTGDSITLAPAMTLTDREYQKMRDAAIAIIREIGVECGGSNVQFAVNPVDGDLVIIEMNPRVSRSSALASKATGFPIAKIAAKLAVGYTLDGIPNDITRATPASFEPSIDYIITKIPRFAFEKFPGSTPNLTTQMKSVGESMAFGRTFAESFQKAMRSLETGHAGFGCNSRTPPVPTPSEWEELKKSLRVPNPERMQALHTVLAAGMTEKEIFDLTAIDPWFLRQLQDLVATEQWMQSATLAELNKQDFLEIKRKGFSDRQMSCALGCTENEVRMARTKAGVTPSFKRVDTCAAEFAAETPYMYSSYDGQCEARPDNRKKVLILGGGPNRIGQGIEFDYCCCHAAFALRDNGFEAIMLNSNPETVSTDYDTSDRLYFEPLTVEDVMNVIERERPMGVIVQFGGQTPLKLAKKLQAALDATPIPCASGSGFTRILGTSPDAIDAAEDRERFEVVLRELGIAQPPGGAARNKEEALAIATKLGYPVMVRPSYVLGGRAMQIVTSDAQLDKYIRTAVQVDPEHPVLVDKYLEEAGEIDVDALADHEGNVTICGIMEHIEQAGVHSGDSACSIPTQTVPQRSLDIIRKWTPELARSLGVVGLLNIQYAVRTNGDVFILEANPRASRTVPFVAKAVGHPIAKYATLLMAGKTLKEIGFTSEPIPKHVSVKEAVLPFDKFPGADTLLGPEMKSTGEVMGIDADFNLAYAKAQVAAGQKIPLKGTVFVSVRDSDKPAAVAVARRFTEMGFKVVATGGTAAALEAAKVPHTKVLKIHEGRPHIGDHLKNREIDLLVVSSSGDALDLEDGRDIRRLALSIKVPLVTTMAGAKATVEGISGMQREGIHVTALQEYHPDYSKLQKVFF